MGSLMGIEFQFYRMKSLEMDGGDGCTKLYIYLNGHSQKARKPLTPRGNKWICHGLNLVYKYVLVVHLVF